jgi:uncharacterized membrane protein HdeD (DUF308 family)
VTILGIVVLVLGFLAVLAPVVSGLAVTISVAILLIVAGILRSAWAFRAQSFGRGLLALLIGGLSVLCGVLMLTQPVLGLLSLTLVLAAYFLVDGVLEIAAALRVRPRRGWGWLLASGVASLVLGLLIWSEWPLSGVWAVGVLVGIKLVFTGTAMITVGAAVKELARGAAAT